MRKTVIIPLIIILACSGLNAQKSANEVTLSDLKIVVLNDYVDISFVANIANNAAKSSYTLFIVPTLTNGVTRLPLSSIVVQGKRAQVAEKRYTMSRAYPGLGQPIFTTNGQKIPYSIQIPYQSWMNNVQLVLDKYSRGCCDDVVLPSDVIDQNFFLADTNERERERQRLEQERLEQERLAQALREQQMLEQQRREQERLEQERLAQALRDKEQFKASQAQREREEQERYEQSLRDKEDKSKKDFDKREQELIALELERERAEFAKRELERKYEEQRRLEEQQRYESPFRGNQEKKLENTFKPDTVYVREDIVYKATSPQPQLQPQSQSQPQAGGSNINQIFINASPTGQPSQWLAGDSLNLQKGVYNNINQLYFNIPSGNPAAPATVAPAKEEEALVTAPSRDTEGDKWSRHFTFVEPYQGFQMALKKSYSEELFDYNMPLNLTRGINRTQQSNLDRFIDENRESALPIIFRQGSYNVERFYAYNNISIVDLISAIRAIQSSDDSYVRLVVIAGFASPEGSFLANDRLAWERAVSVKDIILNNTNLSNKNVSIYNGSVDWRGLYRLVSDSDMYHKYQVLNIIDFAPAWSDTRHDNRLEELKKLAGGEPYKYMLNHIFPLLRNTAYIKVYYENKPITATSSATTTAKHPATGKATATATATATVVR